MSYPLGDTFTCPSAGAVATKNSFCSPIQVASSGVMRSYVLPIGHDPHRPSSLSSPTVRPEADPIRRTAMITPGMNDDRSIESWRITSV